MSIRIDNSNNILCTKIDIFIYLSINFYWMHGNVHSLSLCVCCVCVCVFVWYEQYINFTKMRYDCYTQIHRVPSRRRSPVCESKVPLFLHNITDWDSLGTQHIGMIGEP